MKILFLCGSLAPGKDGVGDYTRRLSGELIRQGHCASVIALNDRYTDAIIETEQESDGTNIAVLRLPSGLSAKERYCRAEQYINEYNPEWLSLQFVPYAFQQKGLPFGLDRRLSKLGKGRKWHIMFHELWIGMDREAPLKHYWIGRIQKYLIKTTVHLLKPEQIHTQVGLYKAQLKKCGIKANILPLFGNIPVLYAKPEKMQGNVLYITIFGSIHYGDNLFDFTEWIHRQERQINKSIHFNFVGSNGQKLQHWLTALDNSNIPYTNYGRQEPDVISKILSESTIGLTTIPYLLVEKSGTAVAMQEHHLPIICLAREWNSRVSEVVVNASVSIWNKDLRLSEVLENKSGYENNLRVVTKLMLQDM
jgi:hypothetical protein